MSEEKIIQIAFAKYPEDKFWIGSGESERLYDQNERDRNKFIEGFKEALSLFAVGGQLPPNSCQKCGRSGYSMGTPFCTDEYCNGGNLR